MNNELLTLIVSAKENLKGEGTIFELRDLEGQDLPAFTPGAHIGVKTPAGSMRQYSLINDPANRKIYQLGIKTEKAGRGGSLSMAEKLKEGDLVQTLPPENNFELVKAAQYLFIAGGIGITPILCMCRTLLSQGHTNITLVYCTREPASTFFHEEISSFSTQIKTIIHHDNGDPAQALDFWPLLEAPDNRHIYCCGPKPLIEDIMDMTGHWPEHQIHFEDFKPVDTVRSDDTEFSVFLKHSNTRHLIPENQSILETLRSAGYELRSSCESGTCGSCKTALLAGEVDHRDLVLTETERKTSVMICVSRAKNGEIILDL